MNTTSNPNAPSSASGTYDQLLATAQAAQSAADRAVADLAAVKRTMAEAPRVLQIRREELNRAQSALAAAELDLGAAREQATTKQNEAARLIEIAADAQRALAQALISQDVMADPAFVQALSARLAAVNAHAKAPAPAPPKPIAFTSSPATLGANRYTPTPAMHPADLHAEVVDHLRERDALCPSCGHSLRAIQSARCPGCKLQLSLNVLQSVRAHPFTATKAIWCVRLLSAFSIVLAAYLCLIIASGNRPFGCGGGSGCEKIIGSPWSKFYSIPIAFFALPVHMGILISSFFLRVGLADTTRRRGWIAISVTSLLAGLAGIWFIGVQLVEFKSVCPHCLLVNLAGITGALIVLKKAPLGRQEHQPPPATGRIEMVRSTVWRVALGAFTAFAVFAGVHMVVTLSNPASQFAPAKVAPDPGNGLMMKGLESGTPSPGGPSKEVSPAPIKSDATPSPAPTTPATVPNVPASAKEAEKEEPSKGLLLPGLELPPAKK